MFHFFTKPMPITRKLTLSFVFLILIGSALLSLPIMHYKDAVATTYFDHLFTTISMVCVTGLSVFPVGEVYNGLGQFICMILIQFGGLGLVTLFALSSYTLNKRISLQEQNLLQSALNYDSAKNLKYYLFNVYKITFFIESLSALLLMFDFIPRFGIKNGIFNSLFLAISGFCNAGFDNFSSNNLLDFKTNIPVNLILSFLIISGGLGFTVWINLIENVRYFFKQKPRQFKKVLFKLTTHSKLVLQTTGIILIVGTLLSLLLEFNNSKTIGNLTIFQKVIASFFQSVTMRTAGFATINYTLSHYSTNLIYTIQMLIGGAPGGTAGGLKITVFAILILMFRSELKGRQTTQYHTRTISSQLVRQTLIVLIFFFTILISGFFLLLITDPQLNPFSLFFEASSALATVGVTMDTTTHLSQLGRAIIMALMFIGRVGPLTVLLSMVTKKEKNIKYANAKIIIG